MGDCSDILERVLSKGEDNSESHTALAKLQIAAKLSEITGCVVDARELKLTQLDRIHKRITAQVSVGELNFEGLCFYAGPASEADRVQVYLVGDRFKDWKGKAVGFERGHPTQTRVSSTADLREALAAEEEAARHTPGDRVAANLELAGLLSLPIGFCALLLICVAVDPSQLVYWLGALAAVAGVSVFLYKPGREYVEAHSAYALSSHQKITELARALPESEGAR